MGSFEKLGILVIVVIIVMILAVAIYQWGGTGVPGLVNGSFEGDAVPLVVTPPARPENVPEVDFIDQGRIDRSRARSLNSGGSTSNTTTAKTPSAEWAGGIPRSYEIQKGDILWRVVVRRWKLKESFCDAIARANPKLRMNRLGKGRVLEIPNPQAYFPRGKSSRTSTRTYEVQVGDRLETISRAHLGKKSRWREIVKLNPGLSPEKIRPGQKIRLPAR